MRLTRGVPNTGKDQTQPERPSHFEDDQNQRAPRNNTPDDYPGLNDPPGEPLGWPSPPPPDPIPVYLTETAPRARQLRRAVYGTYTLGGTTNAAPVQVGGADLRRTRMVIRNNDADTSVFVSTKQGDTDYASFEIVAGKDLELMNNDAVWIHVGTGGGASVTSVSVLSEFETDD